ncbi:MAG: DUF58 domain-containing protein [Paenibacillaceae bacterium]|nr:DUF58 domain-containing protein [Paenibacillaceae bacterium]
MSEFAARIMERSSNAHWRFWIVASCFAGSLLFLLFQGGKLAFMMFIIMFVLTVYLTLGKWSGIARTEGSRKISGLAPDASTEAGTTLTIAISAQIPGFWPIPYVLIKDRLQRRSGGEHLFEASFVPDWKRRGIVEYQTPPLRRGFYTFRTTDCSTEDVFGIFEHTGRVELKQNFIVYPRTVPIKEWKQLHQMLKGLHHHSTTTRALRETTQINGVREYIYGDRLSRIHWNATAKTGTWKSKEFERESLPKTIIVLDRELKQYKDAEQFELAVSIAASLLQYGTQRELAVGLLSVGGESTYFEPRSGHSHLKSMLKHMVEVEANGQQTLMKAMTDRSRLFAPGSFVAVVSPQRGEAMLQTLAWLEHRQLNPCHMWIGQQDDGRDKWMQQLRVSGYVGYPIASLSELPHVLGGRG